MTTATVVLLIVSALAEVFGTVTVWSNYSRGARLANQMLLDVNAEQQERDQFASEHSAQALLQQNDPIMATFTAQQSETKLRQLRSDVGGQLQRDWFYTAGLIAYVVGALAGLSAGLIALSH